MWSRITWVSAGPIIRCGSTSSNGVRSRYTPAGSTSNGTPIAVTCTRKCSYPCLGLNMAWNLSVENCDSSLTRPPGRWRYGPYETHMLPIWPLHYGRVLGNGHAQLERLSDAFSWLTARRPQIVRRAADLKTELAQLVQTRADVREALRVALNRFEGKEGDAASWQALHDLIQEQHWRVAHFRAAADDINYRRFFDINELAGLRMELPEVFDHVHRRLLEWLGDGTLDGLRIDHIDGLQEPKAYLQRLRAHISAEVPGRPIYIVVEKILAPHERLREEWPVEGTTGYDFANQVLGVLIDSDAEPRFTEIYAEFVGERRTFGPIVREGKLRIMDGELAGELNVLARDLARLARQNPRTADFTHNLLRHALKELIACFPVYRTYIDAEGGDQRRRSA